MSASELFDLIRPAITVLSAIVSGWLLYSARKRFALYQAFAWAIAAFFFPLIVVPLYLAVLILWRSLRVNPVKYRLTLPGLYLLILLTIFGVYTFRNSRSVDAHLSRASFAYVKNEQTKTIAEYREVLRLEDNPHNHKLLAGALADAGFTNEAIQEYRIAESGGEPDDLIHFQLGALLDKVDRKDEAIDEFRKFAESKTCLSIDNRCETARTRLSDPKKD